LRSSKKKQTKKDIILGLHFRYPNATAAQIYSKVKPRMDISSRYVENILSAHRSLKRRKAAGKRAADAESDPVRSTFCPRAIQTSAPGASPSQTTAPTRTAKSTKRTTKVTSRTVKPVGESACSMSCAQQGPPLPPGLQAIEVAPAAADVLAAYAAAERASAARLAVVLEHLAASKSNDVPT